MMCVKFTRPVNTVPVKRLGSAIAKKAGGASSVTKVSELESDSRRLCLKG